jgi:hypothetical protein
MNLPGEPPRGEPPPGSAEERAADLRTLKIFVIWLGGCAAVAAILLLIAIRLDWV